MVAIGPAILESDYGDLWNSGIVRSEECTNVVYQGLALRSGMRCYWKVQIWGQNGMPGDFSEPAVWEMGILEPSDWRAPWIGSPAVETSDSFNTPPAPYFRSVFPIDKPLRLARLYSTRCLVVHIRGQKVRQKAYFCGKNAGLDVPLIATRSIYLWSGLLRVIFEWYQGRGSGTGSRPDGLRPATSF